MKKILALSSSRVADGAYLESALPLIKAVLPEAPQTIAFIPFASVDSYEGYREKVSEALTVLAHTVQLVIPANAKEIISGSDAIMIGGGNTFKLLHDLYALDLIGLIKEKVQSGMPYISWSAGSNLCGPTICTTNDMPIIQPESFKAFGFLPFQINPHYQNIQLQGFHGETRDQRLEEFLKLNPGKKIVCLPEGTALKLEAGTLSFLGEAEGILMSGISGEIMRENLQHGNDLSFLLQE